MQIETIEVILSKNEEKAKEKKMEEYWDRNTSKRENTQGKFQRLQTDLEKIAF